LRFTPCLLGLLVDRARLCDHAGRFGASERHQLAQLRRARHACAVSRTWQLIALSLLIAALTLFVSRRFGFTFLFVPLFFAWGSRSGDR